MSSAQTGDSRLLIAKQKETRVLMNEENIAADWDMLMAIHHCMPNDVYKEECINDVVNHLEAKNFTVDMKRLSIIIRGL